MTRIPFFTAADVISAAPAVRAYLEAGGIIAYPTETVYGLGCFVQPAALAALARLKGRDADKPVLLLAASPLHLKGIEWTDAARVLAAEFWPGPLTVALNSDGDVYPPPVRAPTGTVAVRQTPLHTLQALLKLLGAPITSTSANRAGEAAALSADDVEGIVGGDADVLLLDGGAIPATEPSTVIDCSVAVPRLLREGAVARDRLQAVLTRGGFSFDG